MKIIAVYIEKLVRPINTKCTVKSLLKAGGTYNSQWALEG
jgi:hypothetical protein